MIGDGRWPILSDYDLGQRVDLVVYDAGAGGVVANVPGVGMFLLGGGAPLMFPLLAPDGSALAPSYSFATATDAGLWRDTGNAIILQGAGNVASLFLADTGQITLLNANAQMDCDAGGHWDFVAGPGSAFSISTDGGGFQVTGLGEYDVGGNVGNVGDVITSAGSGLPATWAAPSPPTILPTVTLNAFVVGTGAPGYAGSATFAQNAAGALLISGSAGTVGQVPVSAGAGAPPAWSSPPAGSTLTWGAGNLSNTVDTRVVPPGYDEAGILNTDTPRGFAAPRAGTIRNLFVRHQTTNGNGLSITYTLRVNGVLTTLTTSLATAAVGQASDVVHSVAIAQGDLVELVRIIPVLVGSAVVNAIISAQFN